MSKHLYPLYPKGIKLVTDFPVCWINPEFIYRSLEPYYSSLMLEQFFDIFYDVMKDAKIDSAKYQVTEENKDDVERMFKEYKLTINIEPCRFCSYGKHTVYEVEIINNN